MIVHDISNLAGNLSLNCEMLLDTRSQEEIKEGLDSILNSLEDIRRLGENLLAIEKMEEGKMEVDISSVDLGGLIQERSELLSGFWVEYKKIQVIHKAQGEFQVLADKDLLVRVVDNLLINAFKNCPEKGKIVFNCFDQNDRAIFQLDNDGKAIPLNFQEIMFEKFQQLKINEVGPIKGTGLGLSFCKMAINAMGGNISVTSPLPDREDAVRMEIDLPRSMP